MAPLARNTADKQLKFDIIKNLPLEISQKILLLLSKDDVPIAYNYSGSLRNVMSGDFFWKKRCELDNVVIEKTSTFFEQYLKEFDSYWQGLYSYSHMLLNNWKNNNFKKTIRKGSLNNCPAAIHYFDNNVLIISTSKYKLEMIDFSTGNKINKKLGKHVRVIDKVFKIDNYLISYCCNCIFKVWDLSQDGLCITRQVVPGYIRKMAVSKNVIALETTLPSREICVYDFKGTLMYQRNINAGFSTSVCLNDKIFAIATWNGQVNISEFNSETSRTFSVPEGIEDIKIKKGYFLCILYTNCIRVYDTRTLERLHKMNIWQYSILGYMDQDKIVCNNEDFRLIIVWNLTTGHRILKIKNQYPMRYLIGNSQYIITYVLYKNLIKVWGYDTNQAITEYSLETIGLKNHVIISARITTSKLVLLCRENNYTSRQTCIVLLNFENSENVELLIRDT